MSTIARALLFKLAADYAPYVPGQQAPGFTDHVSGGLDATKDAVKNTATAIGNGVGRAKDFVVDTASKGVDLAKNVAALPGQGAEALGSGGARAVQGVQDFVSGTPGEAIRERSNLAGAKAIAGRSPAAAADLNKMQDLEGNQNFIDRWLGSSKSRQLDDMKQHLGDAGRQAVSEQRNGPHEIGESMHGLLDAGKAALPGIQAGAKYVADQAQRSGEAHATGSALGGLYDTAKQLAPVAGQVGQAVGQGLDAAHEANTPLGLAKGFGQGFMQDPRQWDMAHGLTAGAAGLGAVALLHHLLSRPKRRSTEE